MKTMFLSLMLSTLAAGTPAVAQQAAQPLTGPLVPGVCLLSREAIVANAAVGKAALARLAQLSKEAQAEVDAERRPLDVDIKAFQADAAKLTPAQRSQREQALQARTQALQEKAQLRSREIDATRTKALAQIAGYAQPIVASAYAQHKCGLVIDRNVVMGGNMGNDITPDVVKGLDAKITTITFNREILPAQRP